MLFVMCVTHHPSELLHPETLNKRLVPRPLCHQLVDVDLVETRTRRGERIAAVDGRVAIVQCVQQRLFNRRVVVFSCLLFDVVDERRNQPLVGRTAM